MIVLFELNYNDTSYFHLVSEITYEQLVREIGEPYLHDAYSNYGIAGLGRRYEHPDNGIELYAMDVRIANVLGFYPEEMHKVMTENLRDLRIKYLVK